MKHTKQGRPWTVSIALPGSILFNAQKPMLKAYLAGQIARALTIFEVDEIVIFSENAKRMYLAFWLWLAVFEDVEDV